MPMRPPLARLGLAAAMVMLALAGRPAGAADSATLAKGELLFHIGGCANCHTVKDGPLLAGGAPLVTEFGSFYPPNITPDRDTGIGGWSEADFIRAMREGRSPEGEPYYPAFPYTSYTHMTDEDLKALKAYLDTVPAVSQVSHPHELSFPYSQRWGIRLWQLVFFKPETFQPDPGQSEAWNRGAYLVNGPGHCQECHTPRNAAGARQEDKAFTGAQLGKEKVPNITSAAKGGIGDWSEGDLVTFFKLGMMPDGDFAGSDMAKVINEGTSKLPDSDVSAIVTYLKSIPPAPQPQG